MRLHLPGAWYCDARPDGAYVALIPGLRLDTHHGPIALPPGGDLLYVRIAPDGVRFAGQGHDDDRVWEWTGSEWRDYGHAYGVSPVIYDRNGALLINEGAWGSQGARYIDAWNQVVTADATYFSPAMELSEWSYLADLFHVGQSHPDGTNDTAWVYDAATSRHRLLEPGPCRFIRAHREGDRVSIAIWKPHDGAVIYWLTLDEIRSLPIVTLPSPPPPAPEPVPVNQLETIRAIRAKYDTPLGDKHWQFLVEVAHALNAQLFRKDGGDRVLVPQLGITVSMDVIIFPQTREWADILGDAEGEAVPGFDLHPNAGEPEKWIDVSRVILPGEDDDPDPDPPVGDLESRVARLEAFMAAVKRA